MSRMRFVIATPPATEPVSLTELKSQRRITGTDEDIYLTSLISAARMRAENLCGPIITQIWDGYLDGWPCGDTVVIEKPRASAIASVKYTIQGESSATTLLSATYLTDFVSRYARIRLKDGESWPSDTLEVLNPIVIRFTCGYGAAVAVPALLKQAILFLAAHWHANREIVTDMQTNELPETFLAAISDYQEWGY